MTANPYIQYYQLKRMEDQFGFLGLGTAWDYYAKAFKTHGVAAPLHMTGDLYESVAGYEQLQKQTAKRDERAWARKVEIAEKLKKLPKWPANIRRSLPDFARAYPDEPNINWALSMPPNSPADAYAQGAAFSYVTAVIFDKPKFIQLGDGFLKEAKSWGEKGTPLINMDSFLASIMTPFYTVNFVHGLFQDKSGVDITKGHPVAKVMQFIMTKWIALAYQTGILTKWYNLPAQVGNVIGGRDETQAKLIYKMIRNNARPEEIQFAQKIAADSQASVGDLVYSLRGLFVLAGLAIVGVVAGPAIIGAAPGLLSSVGRIGGKVAGKAASLTGRAALGTGKLIGRSASSAATAAFTAANQAANKRNVPEFVQQAERAAQLSPQKLSPRTQMELETLKTLAASQGHGTNISKQQMKGLLKQILVESQGA
jgi:hypothetical protein